VIFCRRADITVGPPIPVNTNHTEEANEDIGVPKEWYSRGYLPHRDAKQLLQAVTFRLADSLPQEKLNLLEEELLQLPENNRATRRREKIEHWLDAGMGCCALRHPKLAEQFTILSSISTVSATNSSLGASCLTMCMCSWKLSLPSPGSFRVGNP
jgi:hypothetical protein